MQLPVTFRMRADQLAVATRSEGAPSNLRNAVDVLRRTAARAGREEVADPFAVLDTCTVWRVFLPVGPGIKDLPPRGLEYVRLPGGPVATVVGGRLGDTNELARAVNTLLVRGQVTAPAEFHALDRDFTTGTIVCPLDELPSTCASVVELRARPRWVSLRSDRYAHLTMPSATLASAGRRARG